MENGVRAASLPPASSAHLALSPLSALARVREGSVSPRHLLGPLCLPLLLSSSFPSSPVQGHSPGSLELSGQPEVTWHQGQACRSLCCWPTWAWWALLTEVWLDHLWKEGLASGGAEGSRARRDLGGAGDRLSRQAVLGPATRGPPAREVPPPAPPWHSHEPTTCPSVPHHLCVPTS